MGKLIKIKYNINVLKKILENLKIQEKSMSNNCPTKDWFKIMNKIKKVKKMIEKKEKYD